MAQFKDPMNGSDQPTSRELRDGIRRTRARMDATVDAIEEKLTPGELAFEAWGLLRGGSGSSVNRIWKIATQHPTPAAIITLGLGWMVYESAGGNARDVRMQQPRANSVPVANGESSILRDAAVAAGDMADSVAGSVQRATSAVSDTAENLAGQARNTASDVADAVRHQGSELGRHAVELGDDAREGLRQARAGFWNTLEKQPFVVGAATLAAGLLVGLLLPSTPQEDELMGKARDSLLEEIKGFGQEALEKGRHIASAAADSLKQGAEAQGLTADAVADTVRTLGRDVVETVKSASDEAPKPAQHRAA